MLTVVGGPGVGPGGVGLVVCELEDGDEGELHQLGVPASGNGNEIILKNSSEQNKNDTCPHRYV